MIPSYFKIEFKAQRPLRRTLGLKELNLRLIIIRTAIGSKNGDCHYIFDTKS